MRRARKYPGALGKPTDPIHTFASGLSGRDWWWEVLVQLMRYYEIDPADKDAGLLLAYRLALDHVPAMRVAEQRRGRPRLLVALDDPLSSPRKSGRPKEWSDELHLELIVWVDWIKAEAEARATTKAKGVSNNRALREVLSEIAKHQRKRQQRAIAAFPRWRRQLTEARKKFPRNSKR